MEGRCCFIESSRFILSFEQQTCSSFSFNSLGKLWSLSIYNRSEGLLLGTYSVWFAVCYQSVPWFSVSSNQCLHQLQHPISRWLLDGSGRFSNQLHIRLGKKKTSNCERLVDSVSANFTHPNPLCCTGISLCKHFCLLIIFSMSLRVFPLTIAADLFSRPLKLGPDLFLLFISLIKSSSPSRPITLTDSFKRI